MDKNLPSPADVVRVGSETPELRRRLSLEPAADVAELNAKAVRPRHWWQRWWRSSDRRDAELAARGIPRFLRDTMVLDENGRRVRLGDTDRLDHHERYLNCATNCLRDPDDGEAGSGTSPPYSPDHQKMSIY